MQANLAIQLSDSAYSALSHDAAERGKTPSELASNVVEAVYASQHSAFTDPCTARQKFEQCFGSVDLGRPVGIANESIDMDLAGEYGCEASTE